MPAPNPLFPVIVASLRCADRVQTPNPGLSVTTSPAPMIRLAKTAMEEWGGALTFGFPVVL